MPQIIVMKVYTLVAAASIPDSVFALENLDNYVNTKDEGS